MKTLRSLSAPLSFAVALAACSPATDNAGAPCPAVPTGVATTSSPPPTGSAPIASAKGPPTVEEAKAFYDDVDAHLRKLWVASQRAAWVNQTDLNDDTDLLAAQAEEASMEYLSRVIPEATRFDGLTLPEPLARLHHNLKIATVLPAPRDEAKRAELSKLVVDMTSMYGKGKYCPARLAAKKEEKDRCLDINAIEGIMAKSRNYDELLDVWTGWHAVGKPMRQMFARYVELGNEGAKNIGMKDLSALWRSQFDMTPEEFEADTDRLWQQLKPFYDELHCYVRNKLKKAYPQAKLGDKSPIPAHLLGNIWAQEWENLYDLVEPYKNEPSLDVTRKMKAKKLDEKGVVKLGERFFVSLGMDELPKTFWERSLFKKPTDRDVVCHASAWDVEFADDLRIKMCVEINETDLLTVHHELGHDYYYHSYFKLPMLFQAGANEGFHEAIGDTLATSVTPGYLKSIGLLDTVPDNEKTAVNVQMKKALERVAFLPFGKIIDQWRWDVFSGKTKPSEYNAAWWALRRRYQGVAPSVDRSEADFDPGAKYHVPANTPYVRYFLAAIYQFQFHRALCKAAGHTGPLHTCSIYGSKEAGAKLKAMLSMGSSRPWPEALAALSGEKQADASAMLEYFAPLRKFLAEQNKGQTCGWE